jgi:RNA-splicing ligase RtcB
MRYGIILGTGLGNMDWNCSAPHGSGRIMKRKDVKNSFTVSSFKSEMKGIYSSCIGKDTLDEAPFAYRPVSEIDDVIGDTVKIDKIIRPVYNFKAGGE